MRTTKYLFITSFLSFMVVCISTPRLGAGGTCSATAPTEVLTHEQILSEFNPNMRFLLGDNFFFGNSASRTGFIGNDIITTPKTEKKGPDAAGKLPDTSTESEPILGYIKLPFLEEFSVSQTADEAWEKLYKEWGDAIDKKLEFEEARARARSAAEKLGKALNDAMNAEPGSEEAKEAAEKVGDAAKEAKETAKKADKANKEYEEASEEYEKASEEYKKAVDKAYEEAEKQNKAAREAAEKAYEATGHGTSNKE